VDNGAQETASTFGSGGYDAVVTHDGAAADTRAAGFESRTNKPTVKPVESAATAIPRTARTATSLNPEPLRTNGRIVSVDWLDRRE
jgi:hypothetical protein